MVDYMFFPYPPDWNQLSNAGLDVLAQLHDKYLDQGLEERESFSRALEEYCYDDEFVGDVLPCPFCGTKKLSYVGYLGRGKDYDEDEGAIYCKECEYEFHGTDLWDILERWNGRKNNDATSEAA